MIVKSQFDKSQGADAIGGVRDIALMKEAHGYDARVHSAGRAGRGCAFMIEEQQALVLPDSGGAAAGADALGDRDALS